MACICRVGFMMILFIDFLVYVHGGFDLMAMVKIAVVLDSLVAGLTGFHVLNKVA
tara:strand:+ start:307 stop:471 length:165 start_codon:yes stop_codon:yes gene_type:complete